MQITKKLAVTSIVTTSSGHSVQHVMFSGMCWYLYLIAEVLDVEGLAREHVIGLPMALAIVRLSSTHFSHPNRTLTIFLAENILKVLERL